MFSRHGYSSIRFRVVFDDVKISKLSSSVNFALMLAFLLARSALSIHTALQEIDGELKGGILADEMGMGKTIQTISLLVSRKLADPTLIVCPGKHHENCNSITSSCLQ
jgi:hypothetical protein